MEAVGGCRRCCCCSQSSGDLVVVDIVGKVDVATAECGGDVTCDVTLHSALIGRLAMLAGLRHMWFSAAGSAVDAFELCNSVHDGCDGWCRRLGETGMVSADKDAECDVCVGRGYDHENGDSNVAANGLDAEKMTMHVSMMTSIAGLVATGARWRLG